jgi:hypothetical protein
MRGAAYILLLHVEMPFYNTLGQIFVNAVNQKLSERAEFAHLPVGIWFFFNLEIRCSGFHSFGKNIALADRIYFN